MGPRHVPFTRTKQHPSLTIDVWTEAKSTSRRSCRLVWRGVSLIPAFLFESRQEKSDPIEIMYSEDLIGTGEAECGKRLRTHLKHCPEEESKCGIVLYSECKYARDYRGSAFKITQTACKC